MQAYTNNGGGQIGPLIEVDLYVFVILSAIVLKCEREDFHKRFCIHRKRGS